MKLGDSGSSLWQSAIASLLARRGICHSDGSLLYRKTPQAAGMGVFLIGLLGNHQVPEQDIIEIEHAKSTMEFLKFNYSLPVYWCSSTLLASFIEGTLLVSGALCGILRCGDFSPSYSSVSSHHPYFFRPPLSDDCFSSRG